MKAKKILVFGIIMFFVFALNAQTSFSCYYREYCYWNEYLEEFEDCEGYDEASLFTMNDNETMFTHTINSMTSTYYVKGKEYDEDNDYFIYNVVSDVGNEFVYLFDPNNMQIIAVFTFDDQLVSLTFSVKAIF